MNASLIIANAALVSLSAFLFLGACSKSIPRPVFSKGHPAAAEDLNSDVKENPTNPDDQDPTKTKGASINPTALKAVMSTSDVSCNGDAGMSDSPPVLRLLTHREYSNSIRDLFEVQSDFGAKLPNENITHGFRNNTAINQVTDSHMPAFLVNARELASEIIPKMDKIANCQVVAGASCAAQFITTIGPRIWRRPLTEAEVMQMRALFQTGAAISNEEGMGLVIRAFLSSPNFVYRMEIGKAGSLDAYETASALSYFIWSTTPDERLSKLADTGELLKEATLVAEANRLLANPKSKAGISAFMDAYTKYSNVLSTTKDAEKFPSFTSDVRQALAKEAEDSMDYWIRVKKAGFSTLFSSDFTVADPILASFYKSQAKKEGSLNILSHVDSTRRGILGLSSVLAPLATATETHPVKRGEFIVTYLLCDTLPPPPPDATFPEMKPGLSTRERFAVHSASACAGCHKKLDGAGFGMEDYDAIGAFRQTDGDIAVDASGGLFDLDDKEHSFNGLGELSALIANSQQARRCFAVQYFQQAQGRFLTDRDICGVRAMVHEFAKKDLSIGELIVKIITNSTYTKRASP